MRKRGTNIRWGGFWLAAPDAVVFVVRMNSSISDRFTDVHKIDFNLGLAPQEYPRK